MLNDFKTVTTAGYGTRIIESLKGIVVGIILVIAGFAVLYFNEGKVDLSVIARTAVSINSQVPNNNPMLNGQLVSVSGKVSSNQQLTDHLFLKPAIYLAVSRRVQVYAWVEKQKKQKKVEKGGSETTETTYSYIKQWEDNPQPSSQFKFPDGHQNPMKKIENYFTRASQAKVGIYYFSPKNATLPDLSSLPLTLETINLQEGATLANTKYLFLRESENGTYAYPEVGDLRISYNVLSPNFFGTIFGVLDGNWIRKYVDTKKKGSLYRLFGGTREAAIDTLHSEYKIELWLFRFIGFGLMWLGFYLLFNPISVILDILPTLGGISSGVIFIGTFLLASILSVLTILTSALLHSLIALLIFIVLFLGALFILAKRKRSKEPSPNP